MSKKQQESDLMKSLFDILILFKLRKNAYLLKLFFFKKNHSNDEVPNKFKIKIFFHLSVPYLCYLYSSGLKRCLFIA